MSTYLDYTYNNAPLMIVTCTALIAMLVEAVRGTKPKTLYFISLIGLSISAIMAILNLRTEGSTFGGMILYGGYCNFLTTLFCAASILTVILSRDYFERQNYHRGEFYILLLFATIGMLLIASANDLIIIFLGIELMSICLYVLAGFIRTKERANEAALKYFLLGAFATGFLLYGIALIYGVVGSTNLASIKNSFAVVSTNILFLSGAGLLIIGLAFKAAIVPFHMWAPDVYEGASTPVTALMSTGAKAAAMTAFITIFIRTFDFLGGRVNDLVAVLAAASMILGNVVAIAQSNIKRMLAYSGIAHAGYMLTGIASGTLDGQVGVMYYLVAYTMMNLGAFAIVSIIEGKDDSHLVIEDYTGMNQSHPMLSVVMSIFMFSLAGIPPFSGFFGKYYVFLAAIKSKMIWLVVIGVLTSLISAYYYLRIIVLMFFREGSTRLSVKPAAAVQFLVVVLAFLVLVLGLYPSPIIQVAQSYF